MSDWPVKNVGGLSRFFRVSKTTISKWKTDGMPGQDGSYQLDDIVEWLLPKNSRGQLRPAYGGTGKDLAKAEVDLRLKTAEAGLREMDLAHRQGHLIPLDLIHECFGKVASSLRQYGESIEKRLGREELLMFDAALDSSENALNKMFDDYSLREHADAVRASVDTTSDESGAGPDKPKPSQPQP